MNIIFIAPPAAGKGTQSSLLEDKYGYIHLSTGDLLRNEVKKRTKMGTEIENIMSKGELVSDDIITELLKNELHKLKNKKFILDGYPRNVEQAHILNDILEELNISNYITIYLELSENIATKRALGRIVCTNCGTSYNKYFQNLMPKENGICDKCHKELVVRSDDNEKTFKNRFRNFLDKTNPVLDFYKEKQKLCKINAEAETFEIFKNIEKILESKTVDNK